MVSNPLLLKPAGRRRLAVAWLAEEARREWLEAKVVRVAAEWAR